MTLPQKMYESESGTIYLGHTIDTLPYFADESINCVVTSPPYWGLRDYKTEPPVWEDEWQGNLGQEPTPEMYVEHLVEVFAQVHRILTKDGTAWLNIGDTYYGSRPVDMGNPNPVTRGRAHDILKPKDLCMIPARTAIALQEWGWWVRSDIIWSKPNPMPSSVKDRPTTSHEYIYLLTKSKKYYYDYKAIMEPQAQISIKRAFSQNNVRQRKDADAPNYAISGEAQDRAYEKMRGELAGGEGAMRNKWSVWTVPTRSFKGAHFAVFNRQLIEPCIKAGCPEGGVVLDPFFGSGTTGRVAARLGRQWIGIDLSTEYCEMAARLQDKGVNISLYR